MLVLVEHYSMLLINVASSQFEHDLRLFLGNSLVVFVLWRVMCRKFETISIYGLRLISSDVEVCFRRGDEFSMQ